MRIERLLRCLLGLAFVFAFATKLWDLFAGERVPVLHLAAIGVEGAIAPWLLFSRSRPRVPMGIAIVFLLVALGRGLYLAGNPPAVLATCACSGSRIPLSVWQGIALTGALLVIAGAVLLLPTTGGRDE